MACPGTERCKYANCETIDLARKIDERVFGKELPIRLRIAISGCTHMCNSPLLNDIGIIGRIRPLRTPGGLCTGGCGTCVEYCRECAIKLKNGISVLDESKCVQCGICIHSCPYHLLKSEYAHYQIMVGGRRGASPLREKNSSPLRRKKRSSRSSTASSTGSTAPHGAAGFSRIRWTRSGTTGSQKGSEESSGRTTLPRRSEG